MTKRNYEIFDRFGNPVDDDILPDGGRLHVPLLLRDADSLTPLQRAVAQDRATRFDDSAARHKPGPVIVADRSAAMQAYADACNEAQNAWRDLSPLPTDATTDGRRKRKGTTYDPQGRVVSEEQWEEEDAANAPRRVMDAAEGRKIKKAAYDAMVAESLTAWKTP